MERDTPLFKKYNNQCCHKFVWSTTRRTTKTIRPDLFSSQREQQTNLISLHFNVWWEWFWSVADCQTDIIIVVVVLGAARYMANVLDFTNENGFNEWSVTKKWNERGWRTARVQQFKWIANGSERVGRCDTALLHWCKWWICWIWYDVSVWISKPIWRRTAESYNVQHVRTSNKLYKDTHTKIIKKYFFVIHV